MGFPTFTLTYLSLGAGKQSTAMAICAALGLHNVPRPDYAIFADTGDEITDTYKHLDAMEAWLREHGIPLVRVGLGITLAAAAALSGRRRENGNRFFVSLPIYVKGAFKCRGCEETRKLTPCGNEKCHAPEAEIYWDQEHVSVARRQCTNEFKLEPIRKKVRDWLGLAPRQRAGGKCARALIGISLDEAAMRMKPSPVPYIVNAYPLVEAKLAVESCVRICKEHLGYVPVKSACRMCPYHDDGYWLWLKTQRPDEFAQAVEFDRLIRDLSKAGLDGAGYVHRSCVPLDQVAFQDEPNQRRLFLNDCEGMCGQ